MLRLHQALQSLAEVYKEPWTSESLKAIYSKVLGVLSLDEALSACDSWLLSDSPFFPKPGQLYAIAMKSGAEERGLAEKEYRTMFVASSLTQELCEGGATELGREYVARFFQSLVNMAIMFTDELSRQRQMLYWDEMHETVSIEEWEYACDEALRRHNFHKLPLPEQLRGYALEYRREKQQRQDRIDAEKRLLLNPPRQGSGDPEENRRNVAALIASVWPGEAARAPEPAMRQALHPAYRAPLQRDPEARKAELRAQLEQLEKEQPTDGDDVA